MKTNIPVRVFWQALLWIGLLVSLTAASQAHAASPSVVISEIMYHPAHPPNSPENLQHEWIELFNRGTETVNLAGWRFSNGVQFVFPPVTLGAGKYLVVAADVSGFKTRYPSVANVVGGWTGRLSNSGERIELVDSLGEVVNSVRYADQGDWSVRELGPVDTGHRGWRWSNAHDGDGRSLELINPEMPNEYGQNWAASLVDGGTPGGPRPVPVNDIAPMILDVAHRPIVPGPGDVVTVTARILDEQTTDLAVTLRYRIDSSTYTNQNTYPQFNAASYRSVPMFDDGAHGDKRAGDGVFGGQIPAQPHGRIVEFFVEARDTAGNVRTWPAPSMVDGAPRQVTNALYQVDGSFDPVWVPGSFPIYYVITTEMERGRLEYIGRNSTLSGPNSQMNATFISVDGTGVELRYNIGIRNRGHGSRRGPPNNQHVSFVSDRKWNGRSALNFNCRNTPGQIMGSAIFRMAGLAAPVALPARLRINGADLSVANMYGVYARIDAFDSFYAEQDFCHDPDGNLYSAFRDAGEADLRYLGTNPDPYRRSYFKESNASQDDWSDLIQLVDVLNNAPEATYLQDVRRVLNVSYWLRYIALDSLLMNYETGLNRGIGDDYYMYRGVLDPRFVLIPHDLDSILDQGGAGPNLSIFTIVRGVAGSNGMDGLWRLFDHPEVVALYHQAFGDLMDDFFNPATLDPLFDRVLSGFAPASRINAMKQSVRQRIAAVQAQIPQKLTINSALPVVSGYRRTTAKNYTLSGTAHAAQTRSVAINGQPATWSPQDGKWQSGAASGPAESLVSAGSEWKYLDDGSNQGTAWYSPTFDDSAWRSGRAELGYGDGDEVTVINSGPTNNRYITTYFRQSFTATRVAWYTSLRLRLLRDDGAVVYLNGVEICRSNMPDGPVNYLTRASVNVAGADERTFLAFDLSPSLLREGVNTLAVEVHQNAPTSADVSFNLALEATRRGGEEASLLPGINRIVVQSFDSRGGAGRMLEEDYVDLWYDTGRMSEISGTLASDLVLDAASGPWRVTGTLTVPAGRTLTIEPGTTLFFNPNAGLTVRGRLLAEGTAYQSITFTKAPDVTARWAGLQLLNTQQESRLVHVNMEYGDAGSCAIRADRAAVYMDHVVWANHTKPYLVFDNSSLVLKNSVLPSLQNAELIHFAGLPPDGQALFEGNWFGSTTGYNDIIDLTGGKRPGPIARFINNTFAGASDDGLDLDGADAHIEGNVFLNVHMGAGNNSPSHAITTGIQNGQVSNLMVVRNLFYDVDHALLAKDGGFITAVNNTVVRATIAGVGLYEGGAGQSQGRGFYGDGNIFYDLAHLFENPDWVGRPTAITMNNSIFPLIDGDPVVWTGAGNLAGADPQFVRAREMTDPRHDLRLLPSSPAIGTGPNGRNMGGLVPAGASISGEPLPVTWRTTATLSVGGPDIYAYKYRVNDGPWSAEIVRPEAGALANPKPLPPVVLTGLQHGRSYTVYVLGKDSAGVWQSEYSPTASRTWTVDTAYRHLVLNEVLALNRSALKHGNAFPDAVELYYDGPAAISLSGMSLSDNPQQPRKFVFGPGAAMNPGAYLVLYADSSGSALDLGFGLSAEGEGVYLYDQAGALVDSVEFGLQVADLSIGRTGPLGEWRLTVPTFGQANVAQPLGDPRGVRINEWLASGRVLLRWDFIELFNPKADPVDLSGMILTDSPAMQSCMHQVGPLSFIAGRGYGVFWANNSTAPGHVNFRLAADGELIGLFDAQGREVDKVIFGAQTTDFSEGRVPDGAAKLEILPLPTPGLPNPQITRAATTTVALVPEWADKRVLVPTGAISDDWKGSRPFNDSSWRLGTGAPGGVGYERSSGYQTLIGLDTGDQMYGTGKNTSCYIRIPFSVDAGTRANIGKLTLKIRYDDGFIAYLNGKEVARRGFTGTPTWNSRADASYEANLQDFDEYIDITAYQADVRAGANILAIHGLNNTLTSSDFLIHVALDASLMNVGQKSAYEEALKLLDGLRVTEIMYRSPQGNNYDYIELKNIIDEVLDVEGVRFDKGIDFVFPALTLQPGEHVVVVSNLSAFRSVYGAAPRVAGRYTGNLSDSGEEIVLLLPSPLDVAILRFDYTEARVPATDGGGRSLMIRNPADPPETWNDPESWRAADPTPGRP